MRPRKEVLLLMANEEELGFWRSRVDLWGYRAHSCLTLDAAMERLSRFPVQAVATTNRAAAERMVLECGQVLLFDVKPGECLDAAHRVEPSGTELVKRVREALKTMTRLKRGPKHAAGKKPAASVGVEAVERRALVRVIKPGVDPRKLTFVHTCTRCGCVFEFHRNEASIERSNISKEFLLVGCPTCGAGCLEESDEVRSA